MSNSFIPNSFQTPNIVIDKFMPLLTGSQYIVLSYAMRHIIGWQDKIADRRGKISLSMFEHGYGDYPGCGLRRPAIVKALKGLQEIGLIKAIGKPTSKGQEWELIFDPDKINNEVLMNHKDARDVFNKARIRSANEARFAEQLVRPTNRETGSSHEPPTGSSHEPPTGSSHEPPTGSSHELNQTQDSNTVSKTKTRSAKSGTKARVDWHEDLYYQVMFLILGIDTRTEQQKEKGSGQKEKRYTQSQASKITNWLKGSENVRTGGKGSPKVPPIDRPATTIELRQFNIDYRSGHIKGLSRGGLTPPSNIEKFIRWFRVWRIAKQSTSVDYNQPAKQTHELSPEKVNEAANVLLDFVDRREQSES